MQNSATTRERPRVDNPDKLFNLQSSTPKLKANRNPKTITKTSGNSSHGKQAASTLTRTLPKLKLKEFDGDPLEWLEWSGMFLSTIHRCAISDDEKMTHLKTLLTGPAKRAFMGMGYSGVMHDTAWQTLQRKFGQPHLIVSTQLSKIQNHP